MSTEINGALLAGRLEADLQRLREQIVEDPMHNPVRELSHQLSRDLEGGRVTLDDIETLIEHLDRESFGRRAEHVTTYLSQGTKTGSDDPLRAIVDELSEGLDTPEAFDRMWSRRHETLVFTGHPTFLLSRRTRHHLAELATSGEAPTKGAGLPDPDITLELEHEQAEAALQHAAAAVHKLNRTILSVARERFPDDWHRLRPGPIGLATWVGYDMDGRTDIGWASVIRHRLHEKSLRLKTYLGQTEALGKEAAPFTDQLRRAHERAKVHAEAFTADLSTPEALIEAANHLTDDKDNLVRLDEIIDGLTGLAATSEDAHTALEAAAIAADMRLFRLGMGEIHFRLNAAQVRHAAQSILHISSEEDLFGRGPLDAIGERIEKVEPAEVNFGSLAGECGASARLFIAMKQILKHIDADSPIRLLIAECENPLTVLAALYQARLFGVEHKVDVCPLFETAVSLDRGRRILDVLLAQDVYKNQVRQRGRISIETGFSDAGRFMGQIPAGLAIERLQGWLADTMHKHGLTDLDAVIYDTHGESMGRGGHPGGIVDRCLYALSPWARQKFTRHQMHITHEQSFQGGDGYVWFTNDSLAEQTLAGILVALKEGREIDADQDPFYRQTSASIDFFNAVKRRQESLFRDPAYNLALGTIGLPLLPQTGSRKSKRQFDRPGEEETSLRRIRAIPHNGMLQQLGFLANILGGLGHAIAVEPEAYRQLRRDSDRFDRLMRLVNRALLGSDMKIFLAYMTLYSGSFWATRPLSGEEPQLDNACATLAETLSDDGRYFAGTQLAARLRTDSISLTRALESMGFEDADLSGHTDPTLDLLHVVRLALLQHAFLLAGMLPAHSADGTVPRSHVLKKVLSLDFDGAADALDAQGSDTHLAHLAGFDEKATYPEQGDDTEPVETARPREELSRLGRYVHLVSVGIANHFGAIG